MSETSNTHAIVAHSLLSIENAVSMQGEPPLAIDESVPRVEHDFKRGDLVRVIDGVYRGMYGRLKAFGWRKGFHQYHPICLVEIPGLGTFTYLRDEVESYGEIERVESEVGNG